MAKKKSQHGGSRTGAGRPPKYDEPKRLSVILEARTLLRLDKRRKQPGLSRNDVIELALVAWLES